MPYSLAIGMGFTLTGLLLLSSAPTFARDSAGGRHWSASVRRCFIPNRRASRAWPRADSTAWRNRCFRSAATPARRLGPLLAAFIVLPEGQHSIAWFSIAALLAISILTRVGAWYKANRPIAERKPVPEPPTLLRALSVPAHRHNDRGADRADLLEISSTWPA